MRACRVNITNRSIQILDSFQVFSACLAPRNWESGVILPSSFNFLDRLCSQEVVHFPLFGIKGCWRITGSAIPLCSQCTESWYPCLALPMAQFRGTAQAQVPRSVPWRFCSQSWEIQPTRNPVNPRACVCVCVCACVCVCVSASLWWQRGFFFLFLLQFFKHAGGQELTCLSCPTKLWQVSGCTWGRSSVYLLCAEQLSKKLASTSDLQGKRDGRRSYSIHKGIYYIYMRSLDTSSTPRRRQVDQPMQRA